MECANRFAILADTEEADETTQGNTDFLHASDVDPDTLQGESPVRNTPVVANLQVSTHSVDKYDLELRFKPKHRNAVHLAKNNATFKRWDDQTNTKYGFIPLGDFICPDEDNRKPHTADLLDIHNHVKSTGNFNFMDAQVSVPSQLRLDRWDAYLEGYWDNQLKFLIRYGFPIDFNNEISLSSEENNHSSATEFPDNVRKNFHDEGCFGAILGPSSTPPIKDLHISPCMTREKPHSDARRVIVDLSFPAGRSVNAGVSKDQYLGTPFLVNSSKIDIVTQKVKTLGKGSLIYKIDISRAFRHIKIDPGDYHLLGLKLDSYFIDSCLLFGFHHGSAIF